MNERDLVLSRRLTEIAKQVDEILEREVGGNVGFSLFVHPFTTDGAEQEFQYISTLPREHVQGALAALLEQWKAGMPDVVPHAKQ